MKSHVVVLQSMAKECIKTYACCRYSTITFLFQSITLLFFGIASVVRVAVFPLKGFFETKTAITKESYFAMS